MQNNQHQECNDSETMTRTCPNCGQCFDGELPEWESGEEECPECETVFYVEGEYHDQEV